MHEYWGCAAIWKLVFHCFGAWVQCLGQEKGGGVSRHLSNSLRPQPGRNSRGCSAVRGTSQLPCSFVVIPETIVPSSAGKYEGLSASASVSVILLGCMVLTNTTPVFPIANPQRIHCENLSAACCWTYGMCIPGRYKICLCI